MWGTINKEMKKTGAIPPGMFPNQYYAIVFQR